MMMMMMMMMTTTTTTMIVSGESIGHGKKHGGRFTCTEVLSQCVLSDPDEFIQGSRFTT
jgi:hypothetical protein